VPILRTQGTPEGKRRYHQKGQCQMISSVFEIELGEYTDTVYRSLCPELEDVPSQRSGVTLELEGGTIKLSIEASDIVSLRAALNTWLRLVKIAHEMAKM